MGLGRMPPTRLAATRSTGGHGVPDAASNPVTGDDNPSDWDIGDFKALAKQVQDEVNDSELLKFIEFLDLMKNYNEGGVDNTGFISRVKDLFDLSDRHGQFVLHFNTFDIPPGYEINLAVEIDLAEEDLELHLALN